MVTIVIIENQEIWASAVSVGWADLTNITAFCGIFRKSTSAGTEYLHMIALPPDLDKHASQESTDALHSPKGKKNQVAISSGIDFGVGDELKNH